MKQENKLFSQLQLKLFIRIIAWGKKRLQRGQNCLVRFDKHRNYPYAMDLISSPIYSHKMAMRKCKARALFKTKE